MHNNYPGGYIIVGIRDDGTPPEEDPNIQWKLFDACKLQDKVRPYVTKTPKIASKVHFIDNHKYCLIPVQSIPDGLPLPFEKDGNDQSSKSIFNRGDLFRINGPQNERISHNHWSKTLALFAELILAKEREMIDAVINRFVDTLIGKNGTIQLSFDMPEESFISTLTQLFESERGKTIDVFLTKINNSRRRKFKTLSLLISIGVYAAFYDNHDIYSRVISILYNFFRQEDKLSTDYQKRLLEYLTCIYALGSACVRSERLGWAHEVIDNEGDGE